VKKQGGFTILEVSLFIAISALVAVSLLAGLRFMIDQQEWHDTLTTLRTAIQTQYQDIQSGLIDRGPLPSSCTSLSGSDSSSTPGTSSCVIIGRVINFYPNSSNYAVNDVIATTPVSPNDPTYATDDITALNHSGLVINPATITYSYKIPWQNSFITGRNLSGSSNVAGAQNFWTIAILQSPISGAILTFAMTSTAYMTTNPGTLQANQTNIPIALLLSNSNNGSTSATGGAICIGPGSSSTNVQSVSPISLSDYNGVFGGNQPADATVKARCGL